MVSISLNAMAIPAAREPRRFGDRAVVPTVATVDSTGFEVRSGCEPTLGHPGEYVPSRADPIDSERFPAFGPKTKAKRGQTLAARRRGRTSVASRPRIPADYRRLAELRPTLCDYLDLVG